MTDLLLTIAFGWLGMWVSRTLGALGARWPLSCARCFTFWAGLAVFALMGRGLFSIALAACASVAAYFFDREAV